MRHSHGRASKHRRRVVISKQRNIVFAADKAALAIAWPYHARMSGRRIRHNDILKTIFVDITGKKRESSRLPRWVRRCEISARTERQANLMLISHPASVDDDRAFSHCWPRCRECISQRGMEGFGGSRRCRELEIRCGDRCVIPLQQTKDCQEKACIFRE